MAVPVQRITDMTTYAHANARPIADDARVVLLETNTEVQEFRLRQGRRLQSASNQYAAVPEESDSDPAC